MCFPYFKPQSREARARVAQSLRWWTSAQAITVHFPAAKFFFFLICVLPHSYDEFRFNLTIIRIKTAFSSQTIELVQNTVNFPLCTFFFLGSLHSCAKLKATKLLTWWTLAKINIVKICFFSYVSKKCTYPKFSVLCYTTICFKNSSNSLR